VAPHAAAAARSLQGLGEVRLSRLRTIFVAALAPVAGGGTGGQLVAATALLESEIRERVEFIPISSTMDSVPPPPLSARGWAAARRTWSFLRALPRADAALIFAADGLSVVEKGLMCLLARARGRGVVLRLSSGLLPQQCERSALMRWWLRSTLRAAHVVCAQGPAWIAFFRRYVDDPSKVVEVRNGVRLRSPSADGGRGARSLAFVGWMHEDKGIFDALEAIELVRGQFPDVILSCAGGGRDRQRFEAAVAARGLGANVRCLGWLAPDAVRELLARSQAFVLPSHYEGLPNAMLEAMAEATPVVVSRVGSIPDVVEDGATGLIVEARRPRELAAALARVLGSPGDARRMGEAARREMERGYDASKAWVPYASALEAAVARARQGRTGAGRSLRSR